jgi:hypothetical protein
VVSSMASGVGKPGITMKPVQSIVLVQGAVSLWSYADAIPKLPGGPAGYYNPTLKNTKVTGPIVTTQSRFDRAVGTFYPIAAGVAGQADFGGIDFPLFGGVGTFGIQGADNTEALTTLMDVPHQYEFQPGHIYNIDSDNIIKVGGGTSGAHSDIMHPEVGHLIWQAALAVGASAGSTVMANA